MTNKFELVSDFTPMGDQPQAIEKLVNNIKAGVMIKFYSVQLGLVRPLPLLT